MNNIIHCVAIDDEPLALDVIEKFCQRLGGIQLHKFTSPQAGLAYIQQAHPPIVFLDIEMVGRTGLDLARCLPRDTCFIFTTAYLHYALEGFDLDAVDYLHKPFAYNRFQAAFAKALRRMGSTQVQAAPQHLVVKKDYSNVSIPLDDIVYIEAIEAYSKIIRLTGECILSRILLKNLQAQLPAHDFVRIHRSFIVSRSKIKEYSRQVVLLSNGKTLPVGRQYSAALVDALMR